ncbi:MAG: hypothetical protein RL227_2644, partial [Pseudomonadota bacterium]
MAAEFPADADADAATLAQAYASDAQFDDEAFSLRGP